MLQLDMDGGFARGGTSRIPCGVNVRPKQLPMARMNSKSKLGPAVAIVSTTSLACGVCCVLPFALPAAVLTLGGGVLAWFASAYRLMTYLSPLRQVDGYGWHRNSAARTFLAEKPKGRLFR